MRETKVNNALMNRYKNKHSKELSCNKCGRTLELGEDILAYGRNRNMKYICKDCKEILYVDNTDIITDEELNNFFIIIED